MQPWAMTQRGRTPNLTGPQAARVYFPFCNSATHFRRVARTKLPGVSRADLAVARRYQPYRGRIFRATLGALDGFANHDKHRTIQPVFALPETGQFNITNPVDCVLGRITKPRGHSPALKVGTELGYVYVRKTGPDPDVRVEGEIATNIAIHEWTRFDRWSSTTLQVICDLLINLAQPPFPLRDVPQWAIPQLKPPPT
jgi:hypothetical protein